MPVGTSAKVGKLREGGKGGSVHSGGKEKNSERNKCTKMNALKPRGDKTKRWMKWRGTGRWDCWDWKRFERGKMRSGVEFDQFMVALTGAQITEGIIDPSTWMMGRGKGVGASHG